MKDRCRVALALAAGYYLGRRRKLRWATALAAAGVAGALRKSEGGGGLLGQGLKILGSSPEIEQLTGRLRGELLEVGKAAAVAATSRQIDSLTEKLHGRAESIRQAGRPRAEEEEPEEEEEEYGEEAYDEEPPEEKPRVRRPRVGRVPSVPPVRRGRR
ncbi:hypothetical protein ACFPOI_32285 [Nonomuraea angiospora]|uniref:Uncharacterized protein n=1 Tax=Nonomuraea angiospora TaxID=46172 RepID=A0ABR9LS63_9ACTN|nr:hypothetical protein [Nonomuraea angiospora]MBE1583506.1 hypothetical protein [Nonomuraea angiospora]